ncbi:MAG: restriction endonuclease subunit S, partial [Oscillospiraceae bacterium]|nr:restriction endonuclease subunit S [Oscillospiraceae bacterium]
IQNYIQYIATNHHAGGGITPLNEKEWREFIIGSMFFVKRPQSRSEKQYEPGTIPFVASGNANNGVINYFSPHESDVLDKRGCITVSPVDGSAFYQETDFLGRGGAGSSIILLYNDRMNKYSGLFLSKMVRQTCSKYNYGKMGNQESIKREKIMLPVDENGIPDWRYMEQYAWALSAKLKLNYLGRTEKLQAL